MEKSMGGTAGNIAYTMKLLGAEPILVSAVGKDGDDYLKYLKKQGIEINNIFVDQKKLTASCYITTDLDDNQITAFHNGAFNEAMEAKLPARSLASKINLAIIAPTRKDTMIMHLAECVKKGVNIMFDPGQQIPVFSDKELKEAISGARILIGNDYEIKMIEKRLGRKTLNSVKILITTLGNKGSVIKEAGRKEIHIRACKAKGVVDPTGAGDAWRAGFLAGYEKGFNLSACGQMGSVAASFAIEKCGTQAHKFKIAEFSRRYRTAYQRKIAL
jgi:adenosine kinase